MPRREQGGLSSSVEAVGVDIGGTTISAGRVDADGAVRGLAHSPTPPLGADPREVEDAIVAAVSAVVNESAVAVGIGAAGFVDRDGRTVRFAPHVSWREEPLADRLQTRLDRPVHVENDANAAAWAEYRFGAGRREPRLLMITLGTGIGGGLVYDGRLERGAHGMAGEFGHMNVVPDGRQCECGNRGCWEQYASAPALRREARERWRSRPRGPREEVEAGTGGSEAVTGEAVSQAARAGDDRAVEALAAVGTWLGRGVADLVAAVDPGTVVVGGGVAQAGELVLGPARTALSRHLSGRGFRECPPIVHAALGPAAGLIGAADLARRAEGQQASG